MKDIEVARAKKGYEVKWDGQEGIRFLKQKEYEVVLELSGKWPVNGMCRLMTINRPGFYKWKRRLEHPNAKLIKRASYRALFKDYHGRFPSHGYRWLNAKNKLDTGE